MILDFAVGVGCWSNVSDTLLVCGSNVIDTSLSFWSDTLLGSYSYESIILLGYGRGMTDTLLCCWNNATYTLLDVLCELCEYYFTMSNQ